MPFFAIFVALVLFAQTTFASHSVIDHIVISEVQVSGATATDEFVELFNPTNCPIPLSGWKLTKKTASGNENNLVASLTGEIPAHGYFLITPQTGYDGSVRADLTYSQTSTTIAADNTVLLYANQAKTFLVDKVGFAGEGRTVESEGAPAPNPPARGSLERANGQDTENNSADFVIREVSDPQNRQSPLVSAPGTCVAPPPSPSLSGTSPTTPRPSPSPSSPGAVAGEEVVSISQARQSATGHRLAISGIVTAKPGQLSANSFYLQDETGGLQVYSSKKTFPTLSIGQEVTVRGEISEANSEKRIKINAAGDVTVGGQGSVTPKKSKTGEIGEEVEGQLVSLAGSVTETSGDTFFIDDGSGAAKIYIKKETGIDKPRMRRGNRVSVTGIVSQYRDDYRVLPREQADLKVGGAGGGQDTDEEEEGAGVGRAKAGSRGSQGGASPRGGKKFAGSSDGTSGIAGAAETTPSVSLTTIPDRIGSVSPLISHLRGFGWAAISLGGLLLLLLPLLIWEKRTGWLRNRLMKPKHFSDD